MGITHHPECLLPVYGEVMTVFTTGVRYEASSNQRLIHV